VSSSLFEKDLLGSSSLHDCVSLKSTELHCSRSLLCVACWLGLLMDGSLLFCYGQCVFYSAMHEESSDGGHYGWHGIIRDGVIVASRRHNKIRKTHLG
jgi:hypothetical protein